MPHQQITIHGTAVLYRSCAAWHISIWPTQKEARSEAAHLLHSRRALEVFLAVVPSIALPAAQFVPSLNPREA